MRTLLAIQLLTVAILIFPSDLVGQGRQARKGQTNKSITRIDATDELTQWHVDEARGRIFASYWKSKLVVEFDRKGNKVNEFAMPNHPQRMISKNNLLVVAMGGSNNKKFNREGPCSVVAIDLDSNTLKKEIPLEGIRVRGLFCSKKDNSLVNGIVYGDRSSKDSLYQIDLASMTLKHTQPLEKWTREHLGNIAMSDDGNFAVGDSKGRSSPSGGDLIRVDEDAFEFQMIQTRHDSFGPISFLAGSRYYLLGNQVFNTTFSEEPSKTFESAKAGARVHPTRDLIVTSDGIVLTFAQFSTGKELKKEKLVLTGDENYSLNRKRSRRSPAFIFFDNDNNVYHCFENACQVISLDEIGIKTTPLLMMAGPTEITTKVGVPVSAKYKPVNRSLRNLNYSIVDGPKGAKFINGELKWTPSFDDLGKRNLKLRASTGKSSEEIDLTVNVSAPYVDLDFHPIGIKANEAATHAVCWGFKIPPVTKSNDLRTLFRQPGPHQIAVIDLVNQSVLVQKQVNSGISAANVDDKFVYISSKDSNSLMKLDRASLKPEKKVVFDGEIAGIHCLPDGRLIVNCENPPYPSNGVSVMDRDFNKSKFFASPDPRHGTQKFSYQRMPFNLLKVAGRIYDTTSGEYVTSFDRLPFEDLSKTAAELMARNAQHQMHNNSNLSKAWSRYVSEGRISSLTGQGIAGISHSSYSNYSGLAVSMRRPVAYFMSAEPANKRIQNTHLSVRLETRELMTGQVIKTQEFATVAAKDKSTNDMRNGRLRMASNNTLLVMLPKKIVVIKPTPETEKLSTPLVLNCPKPGVLQVDKVDSFKVSVSGGQGEIQYGLKVEYPEIEINKRTGEIKINTPKLWQALIDLKLRSGSSNSSRFNSSSNRPGIAKPNPKVAFEQVYGKPLPSDMLPTSLPVSVIATDSAGAQDEVTFYVTVLGSVSKLNKLKQEHQVKRAAQQKRNDKMNKLTQSFENAFRNAVTENQKEARLKKEKTRLKKRTAPPLVSEDQRLDAIEENVRKMEKTAEKILKELDELIEKK